MNYIVGSLCLVSTVCCFSEQSVFSMLYLKIWKSNVYEIFIGTTRFLYLSYAVGINVS